MAKTTRFTVIDGRGVSVWKLFIVDDRDVGNNVVMDVRNENVVFMGWRDVEKRLE